ncbi:MAG: hydantoinase B/oxoprolinase family protein, partial [Nitriliruptorales bacterium]|nr:hydantoinase B/oxoprolinase family protein [Nitriliruptorales bacterium]
MTDRRLDSVLLEVVRGQLQGVVEEMGELVMRCGHTVFVKETQDFVVALVTPEGEVAACSERVGIWIGIGQDFKAVIDAGGPYQPGDVWFTNDPEQSAGLVTHLPDTFCWRPIFDDGTLLCFAAAFIHCTDVGGLAPGSIAPSAVDQHQEGIVMPVTRLVAGDEIRREILDIFLRNSRIPEQNRGDLLAMLGALRRAEARVDQLVAKLGSGTVRAALYDVLDYAEEQARAIIRDLPDGDHVFWDYLEGDLAPGGRPVRIRLALRVRGDELTLDFEGTDPQVTAAFNIPSYGRDGHYLLVLAIVNYLRTVQPRVVYNSGLVRPVKLAVPRGTLLNPEPMAPCGARQATFFRVADVVLGALAVALPDRMPAAGCGQGSIMLVSTPSLDGQRRVVSIVQPLVGGSGGRRDADGTDGVDFATGFYRNIPSETLESEVPVLVERYGLREDSGGPGRIRGGTGLRYSIRMLATGSIITARGLERFSFQPWGRQGGGPGANGRCVL